MDDGKKSREKPKGKLSSRVFDWLMVHW
jgi:hypothetical protein